jgi:hypothetical protein
MNVRVGRRNQLQNVDEVLQTCALSNVVSFDSVALQELS